MRCLCEDTASSLGGTRGGQGWLTDRLGWATVKGTLTAWFSVARVCLACACVPRLCVHICVRSWLSERPQGCLSDPRGTHTLEHSVYMIVHFHILKTKQAPRCPRHSTQKVHLLWQDPGRGGSAAARDQARASVGASVEAPGLGRVCSPEGGVAILSTVAFVPTEDRTPRGPTLPRPVLVARSSAACGSCALVTWMGTCLATLGSPGLPDREGLCGSAFSVRCCPVQEGPGLVFAITKAWQGSLTAINTPAGASPRQEAAVPHLPGPGAQHSPHGGAVAVRNCPWNLRACQSRRLPRLPGRT